MTTRLPRNSRGARRPDGFRGARGLALLAVAGLAAESEAANVVANGDFGGGFASWETAGSVDPLGGFAILSDTGAERSLLFQVAATSGGHQQIGFDFLNATSPTAAEGTLPDTFFASLYLVPDPALFDPAGGTGFDLAIPLVDIDAAGLANVQPTARTRQSAIDRRFTRFTATFDNPLGLFVAIVFDLVDLNFVGTDSTVAIDNVAIDAAPPEPDTPTVVERDGQFLVVAFGGTLDVSADLATGGWVNLAGTTDALVVVLPDPGGLGYDVRLVPDGSGSESLAESAVLGMRRFDFSGGHLQVAVAGSGDWTDLPSVANPVSPVLVATPDARERYFRSRQQP
jgi:hypothetical protein